MKKYLLTLLIAATCSLPVLGQFSIQKVVLEEHTGAWCGYCPDGAVRMEQVLTSYQNAIGVSFHNGDAMTIPEQAELGNFYVNGYPNATINRQATGQSRGVWASQTNTALQGASNVTVSFDTIMYNATTREITADVSYMFTGPVTTGDLRVNFYVIEDNVVGSGSGYNQANYDNGTAGHPYQGAGNPITGYNHRHVIRHMSDGAWGLSGVISTPVNFGSSATHTFNYTLPASYDETEIHLVALIANHAGSGVAERKILNGEEMPLMAATALENGLDETNQFMNIYPNPMNDRATIAFSVMQTGNITMEVVNSIGQRVAVLGQGIMGEGAHTLYWDGRSMDGNQQPNGLYFVRMTSEHGQKMVKSLVLAR